MKNYPAFITLAVIIFNCTFATNCPAQTPELNTALQYLNAVRANPGAYSKDAGTDLSDITPMPALVWNVQLAEAARRKAEDMAARMYFDHIDPDGYGMNYYIHKAGYTLNESFLKDRSNNFFESISAGTSSPKAAIINLISDGNEAAHEKAGHRLHLLGIKDFWKNCQDIGIGWASNPNAPFKTYCVVLIAKHSW